MGVYYMRPTSDDKANWTEVPGGSAWSILNENITEADTPDTSTNYVEAPTSDAQINRQYFASLPAMPQNEMVTEVRGYWYIRAATTVQSIDLSILGLSGSITANLAAGQPYQWVVAAAAIGFNISDVGSVPSDTLTSLRMHSITNGVAGAGTARIAALFLKLTTVQRWTPPRMPFA